MSYSGRRISSEGTERKYLPRPQSCCTTYEQDALHSPSGQRIQPSWNPGTQAPSCNTSTARGGSMRLTSPDTALTVGGQR